MYLCTTYKTHRPLSNTTSDHCHTPPLTIYCLFYQGNNAIQHTTRCLHCAQVRSMYPQCCGWSLHHSTNLCAWYHSAFTIELFTGQVKILSSISTKTGDLMKNGSGYSVCCKWVKFPPHTLVVQELLCNAHSVYVGEPGVFSLDSFKASQSFAIEIQRI